MMVIGFEWDVTMMMENSKFAIVLYRGFDTSPETYHARNCTCGCWWKNMSSKPKDCAVMLTLINSCLHFGCFELMSVS